MGLLGTIYVHSFWGEKEGESGVLLLQMAVDRRFSCCPMCMIDYPSEMKCHQFV